MMIGNKGFFRFLLFASFALIWLQGKSQSGTTMEEYNYVTKGLKIQLESGLDMKNGYAIIPVDTLWMKVPYSSYGEIRSWEIAKLMRVDLEQHEIAAYIIRFGTVYKVDEANFKDGYFCIARPNSSEEVIQASQSHLSNKVTGPDRLHAIIFLMNSVVDWE